MSSINRVILTLDGEILNPATAPYLRHSTAQALRKHLAEPPKGEAPRVQLEASGTENKSPQKDPGVGILHDAQRQRKAFVTMQAEFARVGFELKSKQHPAGITLFEVSRHGQTRVFSAWHDVSAFLTQVQQSGGSR